MLDVLKFVQGAVSRKDYVPELTHFKIQGGRITGYNGKLVLSSPIALDLDCFPKAAPFVKAISACEETVHLHLTPTGKLSVRSGNFRTLVETVETAFTGETPEGVEVKINGKLLPVLKLLYDITSEDASRPWSNGILFDGHSAYATNNVVLIEHWLGYHFPYRLNVPAFAIKELLRIGEEPERIWASANNATFFFSGDRWLRTQLLNDDWPDVRKLFESIAKTTTVVPEGLFEALSKLQGFVDDTSRVFVNPGRVASAPAEEGTIIELPAVQHNACFNINMLRLLEGVATRIGFEAYPATVPFYGDLVRGLIAGMRVL